MPAHRNCGHPGQAPGQVRREPVQKRFATGEAVANLRYLEVRDYIVSRTRNGQILCCRLTGA